MWRRFRKRQAGARPRPEVVVVTRAGCHLCEEMLAVVAAGLGTEADADVQTLDIDAALAEGEITEQQHERWTTLVPVLLVDGREVAHYRVDPGQVGTLLGGRSVGRGAGRSWRFGGSGGATLE